MNGPTPADRVNMQLAMWANYTERGVADRAESARIMLFDLMEVYFPNVQGCTSTYKAGDRRRAVRVDADKHTLRFADGLDLDEYGQERRKV